MAIKLRANNPYSIGVVVRYKDGSSSLHRTRVTYVESKRDKIHVANDDEDLTQIAYKYYGDSKLWWLIADANNLIDPFVPLANGRNLIIPDKDLINVTLRR